MSSDSTYPLSGFEVYQTTDAAEATHFARSVMGQHTLKSIRDNHESIRIHTCRVADMSICYMRYGSGVDVDVTDPVGCFRIIVPMGTTTLVAKNGRRWWTLTSGSYAVINPSDITPFQMDSEAEFVSVSVPPQRLHSYVRSLGIGDRFPTGIPLFPNLSPASPNAVGATVRLLIDTLDRHGRRPSSLVGSELQRMLFSTLFFTHDNALSARYEVSAPVERAATILARDPAQPLDLPRLAHEVGTSVRTLQEGFRREKGMSPSQFHLGLRLELAREMIDSPLECVTVNDVAEQVGFSNAGRFARAYQARFGEFPGVALRARRGR